jgi:imidazole glycerol phosphate synthase subunit HisF
VKYGAASMHLNIRKEDEKRYDLDVFASLTNDFVLWLREVKDESDIFLIAIGYVRYAHRRLRLTVGLTRDGSVDLDKAVSDTKAILNAGADLVLIGQAAMEKPTIVQKLAERLGKLASI